MGNFVEIAENYYAPEELANLIKKDDWAAFAEWFKKKGGMSFNSDAKGSTVNQQIAQRFYSQYN